MVEWLTAESRVTQLPQPQPSLNTFTPFYLAVERTIMPTSTGTSFESSLQAQLGAVHGQPGHVEIATNVLDAAPDLKEGLFVQLYLLGWGTKLRGLAMCCGGRLSLLC